MGAQRSKSTGEQCWTPVQISLASPHFHFLFLLQSMTEESQDPGKESLGMDFGTGKLEERTAETLLGHREGIGLQPGLDR